MRPRGELRAALESALSRLTEARGPVDFRALAEDAALGDSMRVRMALRDMERAGAVVVAGREKPAGSRHWHKLYEPPRACSNPMEEVVRGWVTARV